MSTRANKKIIARFNAEKVLSETVKETREKVKKLHQKKQEVVDKFVDIKSTYNEIQETEKLIEFTEKKLKKLDEFINEAELALLNDFKGLIAYKKTEFELGEINDIEQFNKRFIENLTDPSFRKNNDLQSLIREAKEKYGINITN